MKKISYYLAVCAVFALALVSCSKESTENISGIDRSVSFYATTPETKTAFGALNGTKYPTLWTANDSQVKISLNLGSPVDASVTPAIDGKSASFTATVSDDGSGSYTFFAVSPSSAYSSLDKAATKLTVSIPATQTALTGSPDESAQIIVARSATTPTIPGNVSLPFQHFTAYGKLSFSNLALSVGEVISSVEIISDVALAGEWDMNVSSGVISTTSTTKSIKVNTSSSTDVWFACGPADLSGTNLSVNVMTDQGVYKKTIAVSSGKAFRSGHVVPITIDMTGVEKSPVPGWFLNKDGSFSPARNLSGENESYAAIAYVGSVPNYFDHFIAIALYDCNATDTEGGTETVDMATAHTRVEDFAANHPVTIKGVTYNTNTLGGTYYDRVAYNQSVASASRTDAAQVGWRIPSVTDWRYIFEGATAGNADGKRGNATSPVGIGNSKPNNIASGEGAIFGAAINALCGNEYLVAKSYYYWSSSQAIRDGNKHYHYYRFDMNFWGMITFDQAKPRVRAVFAY